MSFQLRKRKNNRLKELENNWHSNAAPVSQPKRHAKMSDDIRSFVMKSMSIESPIDRTRQSSGTFDMFSCITSTFNFRHHEGTDPNLELKVLKVILVRESLLMSLQFMSDKFQENNSTDEKSWNNILEVLAQIRDSTLNYLEALCLWRQSALNNDSNAPRIFFWEGINYTIKITQDLDFLADNIAISEALGISQDQFRSNPLMLTNNLEDPNTWMDPADRASFDAGGVTEGPTFHSRLRLRYAERILLQEIELTTLNRSDVFITQSDTQAQNGSEIPVQRGYSSYYDLENDESITNTGFQRQSSKASLPASRSSTVSNGNLESLTGTHRPTPSGSAPDTISKPLTEFEFNHDAYNGNWANESKTVSSFPSAMEGPSTGECQAPIRHPLLKPLTPSAVDGEAAKRYHQSMDLPFTAPPEPVAPYSVQAPGSPYLRSPLTAYEMIEHKKWEESVRLSRSGGSRSGGPRPGQRQEGNSQTGDEYEKPMLEGVQESQELEQNSLAMNQSTKSVESVSTVDVHVVANIRTPPRSFVLAAAACVVLLTPGAEVPLDVSWGAFVRLCNQLNISEFMTQLDPLKVPKVKVIAIKPLLEQLLDQDADLDSLHDNNYPFAEFVSMSRIISWVKQFTTSALKKYAAKHSPVHFPAPLRFDDPNHSVDSSGNIIPAPASNSPKLTQRKSSGRISLEPIETEELGESRPKMKKSRTPHSRDPNEIIEPLSGVPPGRKAIPKVTLELVPYHTELVNNKFKHPLLLALLTSSDVTVQVAEDNASVNSAGSADNHSAFSSVQSHRDDIRYEVVKPLDRLVVKVYDIIDSVEALVNINMREYRLFLEELNVAHQGEAINFFDPEDGSWWARNARFVFSVKARPHQKLHLTISKKAIERIVVKGIHDRQHDLIHSLDSTNHSQMRGDADLEGSSKLQQPSTASKKEGARTHAVEKSKAGSTKPPASQAVEKELPGKSAKRKHKKDLPSKEAGKPSLPSKGSVAKTVVASISSKEQPKKPVKITEKKGPEKPRVVDIPSSLLSSSATIPVEEQKSSSVVKESKPETVEQGLEEQATELLKEIDPEASDDGYANDFEETISPVTKSKEEASVSKSGESAATTTEMEKAVVEEVKVAETKSNEEEEDDDGGYEQDFESSPSKKEPTKPSTPAAVAADEEDDYEDDFAAESMKAPGIPPLAPDETVSKNDETPDSSDTPSDAPVVEAVLPPSSIEKEKSTEIEKELSSKQKESTLVQSSISKPESIENVTENTENVKKMEVSKEEEEIVTKAATAEEDEEENYDMDEDFESFEPSAKTTKHASFAGPTEEKQVESEQESLKLTGKESSSKKLPIDEEQNDEAIKPIRPISAPEEDTTKTSAAEPREKESLAESVKASEDLSPTKSRSNTAMGKEKFDLDEEHSVTDQDEPVTKQPTGKSEETEVVPPKEAQEAIEPFDDFELDDELEAVINAPTGSSKEPSASTETTTAIADKPDSISVVPDATTKEVLKTEVVPPPVEPTTEAPVTVPEAPAAAASEDGDLDFDEDLDAVLNAEDNGGASIKAEPSLLEATTEPVSEPVVRKEDPKLEEKSIDKPAEAPTSEPAELAPQPTSSGKGNDDEDIDFDDLDDILNENSGKQAATTAAPAPTQVTTPIAPAVQVAGSPAPEKEPEPVKQATAPPPAADEDDFDFDDLDDILNEESGKKAVSTKAPAPVQVTAPPVKATAAPTPEKKPEPVKQSTTAPPAADDDDDFNLDDDLDDVLNEASGKNPNEMAGSMNLVSESKDEGESTRVLPGNDKKISTKLSSSNVLDEDEEDHSIITISTKQTFSARPASSRPPASPDRAPPNKSQALIEEAQKEFDEFEDDADLFGDVDDEISI